jgi:hypothetical protein
MNETGEMQMCFDEMEKLRAKMEALREKRKANEEKRLLNETMMEPNLKVLKTWLDDYLDAKNLAIENTNKKATQQMKTRAINNIRDRISNIIQIEKQYQDLSEHEKKRTYGRSDNKYKYNNIDFGQLEIMLVSLERDPYNVLSKKITIVEQLYNTGKYVKQRPTQDEIIKSHIEATYNMFNIINKRLDDIEKKT